MKYKIICIKVILIDFLWLQNKVKVTDELRRLNDFLNIICHLSQT